MGTRNTLLHLLLGAKARKNGWMSFSMKEWRSWVLSQGQRNNPRGGAPGWATSLRGKALSLRRLFLQPSVWGFYHISRFVLKNIVIA